MNLIGKLGLVIPTLNEEGNVAAVLARAVAALGAVGVEYDLLVVDGGSSDRTAQMAREYALISNVPIRILLDPVRRGLAGAVMYGWQNTEADVLGVMDADLQHPPELLPNLLRALDEDCDIAVASRYAGTAGTDGWHPLRRLVSILGAWTTLPLQKPAIRVNDPLSGFFLVRRRCVEGVPLHLRGFKILLEILVRGRVCSAIEVPYQFGLRHTGRSKASFKVAWDYVRLLASLFLRKSSNLSVVGRESPEMAVISSSRQMRTKAQAAGR